MNLEMVTQHAFDLIAKNGKVMEVSLKPDGDIQLWFEKGGTTTLGAGFKFGYSGDGAKLFATWLRAAEFMVSDEEVTAMKAPLTLLRPGVTATMVRDVKARAAEMRVEEEQRQAVEERRRREAAARRREEIKRQTEIRNSRRMKKQCVMCGKSLGFLPQFLSKDRHPGCKTFKEPETEATQ